MTKKQKTDKSPEATQQEQAQPEQNGGEDLATLLEQAARQRDEYLQMAQRVQADFDNFRRRNRQVAAESFDDGARAFIKTLLPVVDNLERALSEERQDDPLYTGVALVHRQLLDTLKGRGIDTIDRPGQPFDPNLEDAVAQGLPEEGEPGTVCDVVLKGYRMGDTVLRHAMVRVVPG